MSPKTLVNNNGEDIPPFFIVFVDVVAVVLYYFHILDSTRVEHDAHPSAHHLRQQVLVELGPYGAGVAVRTGDLAQLTRNLLVLPSRLKLTLKMSFT